jgi:hypothetical protein
LLNALHDRDEPHWAGYTPAFIPPSPPPPCPYPDIDKQSR